MRLRGRGRLSAFIPFLRGAFLYLSERRASRRLIQDSSVAHRLTRRFIAGRRLEDALDVIRGLAGEGYLASLDYLGENITALADADAQRIAYCSALDRISRERLPGTISVKVTALGLDISEQACRSNMDTLARLAAASGTRLEMDMESSAYTGRNLAIAREMQARHGSIRAVIQAYLYRSESDIDLLCRERVPVRLCKGAYREPPAIAWPDKQSVDASFVRLMKTLLDRGEYPALATHDDAIIEQALTHVRARGIASDAFEFEMLYGVRRDLQRRLRDAGCRVRLYVPYGEAWYPYFMRRLAERPANILFLLRNLWRG
ncbi:MAG: proline dehydrogenase family protein [Acidobacteria bacterium]|nr:proline dehydrogenase family protein [Acidobacteriota bacterium]